MKKKFFAPILLLHLFSYAQKTFSVDQPYIGLPMRKANVIEVNTLQQLPSRIRFTIKRTFDSCMTDFVNNIVFVKGQIIDLERWAAQDSIFQTEYHFVIPKYELFFELRDTSIGVKSYCFELSMDQYGQITQFDWPREGYNKKVDFINTCTIKAAAVEYAIKQRYKTDSCLYELRVDECDQALSWHISFLQNAYHSTNTHSEEYKTILLDVRSPDVLGEMEMSSYSIAD